VLYGEPNVQPQGICDRVTDLVLKTGSVNRADLTDGLIGMCEVLVAPNPRSYKNLRAQDDGCGSTIYTGSRKVASEQVFITITDNRGRTCEDVVPALIVVNERTRGMDKTMYSYDGESND
jgi:hypothetical protein